MKKINGDDFDVIVVGAGISGLTIARQCAENNLKVLLIEKRKHIGGNCYDSLDKHGVLIHNYGPHIFHSFNKKVYSYLKRFGEMEKYDHQVIGRINNKYFPIPFNFESIDCFYSKEESKEIKSKLIDIFGKDSRVTIFDLINHKDEKIKSLGNIIFKNVFETYTTKQWGEKPTNISKDTLSRIPVVIGRNRSYFPGQVVAMPKKSFTEIFEKMVFHKNITLMTNCSSENVLEFSNGKIKVNGETFSGEVFYSGPIDELFNFKFEELPYRSLNLKFQYLDKNSFQKSAVVNYTMTEDFTRITEFKKLTNQRVKGTTILKEYPQKFEIGLNERFYPISNIENNERYSKYLEIASKYSNLHLIGRLGKYKYYNIDQSIIEAMNDFHTVYPNLKFIDFKK